MYHAIVFVGFPGSGKTSIARELQKYLENTVLIEQDQFYKSNKCDVQGYLDAIKETIKNHNVILCKNHHTHKSLNEVIDIVKENYYIFNLVPDLKNMSKEDENIFIDSLLYRIENRVDSGSHLVIDEDKSYERARNIIIHGFLKSYEEPTEIYYQLNYLTDIRENIEIILQLVSK
jgi:uridine kinase